MKNKLLAGLAVVASVAGLGAGLASAGGTETLGPPVGITIAGGTGTAVGGVGLGGVTTYNLGTGQPNQAGTFSIDVPSGAAVKQVLLYWEGHSVVGEPPDEEIVINGLAVTGTLIGGPTTFFADVQSASFRADITGLNLVAPGNTSLTVSGMDNSFANNGAGVYVIFDEGTTPADITVRDGNDNAFFEFSSPLDTTTPQTFSFTAEAAERIANLSIMAASVGGNRPNAINLTTGGTTTKLVNPLFSNVGPEWDAITVPVTIPGGADSLTVQLLSESDGSRNRPASLSWVLGGLSVPQTTPREPPTGAGTGTPGYWMNHPEAWPVESIALGGTSYTKAQAIAIMKNPTRKDMTYALAAQLIAAKLNVLVGTDDSCISDTIADGDAFLAARPVGSGVRASSTAWQAAGEPAHVELDAYNNGLLCAPSRDS